MTAISPSKKSRIPITIMSQPAKPIQPVQALVRIYFLLSNAALPGEESLGRRRGIDRPVGMMLLCDLMFRGGRRLPSTQLRERAAPAVLLGVDVAAQNHQSLDRLRDERGRLLGVGERVGPGALRSRCARVGG